MNEPTPPWQLNRHFPFHPRARSPTPSSPFTNKSPIVTDAVFASGDPRRHKPRTLLQERKTIKPALQFYIFLAKGALIIHPGQARLVPMGRAVANWSRSNWGIGAAVPGGVCLIFGEDLEGEGWDRCGRKWSAN